MKTRSALGAAVALLLLMTAACGEEEFRPTSLRLTMESDLAVGETSQIEVFAVADDGREEPVTENIQFATSDEAVATVDETGLVTVHARGPLTITATADLGEHGVLEGEFGETTPKCEYPEHDGTLGGGKVVPPLRWFAKLPSGQDIDFNLEDVYCNAEWRGVTTIHFVFSAGWCGPCTDYAKELSRKANRLRQLGMQIVTVELDTLTPGEPANTEFAYEHLSRISNPVAGIAAGDLNTILIGAPQNGRNFLRRSGFIASFPTRSVVRTRDMKMIVDGSHKGPWYQYVFPLEEIAAAPEADWSNPTGDLPEQPNEPGVGDDEED